MSIAERALRDEAQWRKEGRYADADQIIKTLLLLLSLLPPLTARDLADHIWDGSVLIGLLANVAERLHEWEMTPRPGRRGTSCRWRPARLGGGALPWAIMRIILSNAGGQNARGYPACWIEYWRRQRCWRKGRRGVVDIIVYGGGRLLQTDGKEQQGQPTKIHGQAVVCLDIAGACIRPPLRPGCDVLEEG